MSESGMVKFEFEGHGVRTVQKDGEPWFIAKDVCECLELGNSSQALSRLDDEERGVISNDTPSGKQEMAIVNESGLYNLILGSRKPEAKRFKKWVTSEVLPSIRKHGVYATPEALYKMLATPDGIIQTLTALKNEQDARRIAESKAEALNLVATEQGAIIKAQAPKVEYHDHVLNSEDLVTINTIAADVKMSAVALNRFLMESKVVYKEGKTYQPFAKYRPLDYFKHKTIPYIGSDGEKKTREHLYVTQKGKKFIFERLGKTDPGQDLFAKQEVAQ